MTTNRSSTTSGRTDPETTPSAAMPTIRATLTTVMRNPNARDHSLLRRSKAL